MLLGSISLAKTMNPNWEQVQYNLLDSEAKNPKADNDYVKTIQNHNFFFPIQRQKTHGKCKIRSAK